MNESEDYLNPPRAATREPQTGGCDMNAFRAELLRNPNWHAEAELRNAMAYAAPLYGAIDKMLGGTE